MDGKDKQIKSQHFKALKNDFLKITWPGPKIVTKQSVTILIISIIVGLIIVLLDAVIQLDVELLVQF